MLDMQDIDEHGHLAFFYGSQDERIKMLAGFFREGLEKDELCVFATPDTPKQVIENFRQHDFDPSKYIKSGAFRIFEMNETYLPHGQFVANYMLTNVANFILDAETHGYTGLRTAGEMSWLHDQPDSWPEAFAYEDMVNTLGEQHPEFTGLCLYPVQDSSAEILKGAVKTHPSFIYQGNLRRNSLFGTSSELDTISDKDAESLPASVE